MPQYYRSWAHAWIERVGPARRRSEYAKRKAQGKLMSDTIELLEAIGRDASLRHAPAGELGARLEQAHASGALKAAVASGDVSRLSMEFGAKTMYAPQTTQTFHEGDGLEEESEPQPLPAPDPGQTSPLP